MKTREEQIRAIESAIKYLIELTQGVKSGQVTVHHLQIDVDKSYNTIKDN